MRGKQLQEEVVLNDKTFVISGVLEQSAADPVSFSAILYWNTIILFPSSSRQGLTLPVPSAPGSLAFDLLR